MIGSMLRSVREHLGMEAGYVSEFVGGDCVFRVVDAPGLGETIKPGDSRALDDVYCRHILSGRLPEIICDAAAVPLAASLPITRTTGIGAHASVPVRLAGGEVYGMFCCFSPRPDMSLNNRDLQVMRAFAGLAAAQIDRDRAAKGAAAERQARIETVIREGGLSTLLQPIFDFAQTAPVGFECLSRFEAEPRRTPDVWFAEAAEVGLGVDLELAAIRRAIETARPLPDHVYVTVNASAEALVASRFADAIAGIAPERLVIELTEHAMVAEYETLLARLAPLRARGAKLAIDDAGAGYAGLQHFVQLKPDLIKLDMALTRNIDRDPARRALTSALIFYARETGSQIIAEGIETTDELQTLTMLGIRRGQGYLLGRPCRIAEAVSLVSRDLAA